jgi:hypothetical protein
VEVKEIGDHEQALVSPPTTRVSIATMYIGIGTVVFILLVLLIIWFVRRA